MRYGRLPDISVKAQQKWKEAMLLDNQERDVSTYEPANSLPACLGAAE